MSPNTLQVGGGEEWDQATCYLGGQGDSATSLGGRAGGQSMSTGQVGFGWQSVGLPGRGQATPEEPVTSLLHRPLGVLAPRGLGAGVSPERRRRQGPALRNPTSAFVGDWHRKQAPSLRDGRGSTCNRGQEGSADPEDGEELLLAEELRRGPRGPCCLRFGPADIGEGHPRRYERAS